MDASIATAVAAHFGQTIARPPGEARLKEEA